MHYIVSTGAVGLSVIFVMLYCYYGPCRGILVLTKTLRSFDPKNMNIVHFGRMFFARNPRPHGALWCIMWPWVWGPYVTQDLGGKSYGLVGVL